MTHRWRIHSEQRGNPADPRPREALEAAQQHDPIIVFGAKLQEQGVATVATLAQIDRDVREAIEAAVAFAKESPLPQPEDALQDVFAP
jgi:TPP-dependent pyruvate/acetoin dehydrogenase alpha subunit